MMGQADKRWLSREERWRKPADRELFDPSSYGVEVVPEREARALVCEHHYSGSFPAARLSVGLLRAAGAVRELVGTAVFSVPMNQRAVTAHAGVEAAAGVELGRFVCLPSVAYNGETWFLRRALKALQAEKSGVRAVLSYADPMERATASGLLCKPAHAGTIYQGSNAAFLGRARARWLWLTAAGNVVSERSLSKIKAQHRGHRYAESQLVDAGADPRRFGEDPAGWIGRILVAPTFRRLKHPGNFTYVFGLDSEVRARAIANSLTYPKLRLAA